MGHGDIVDASETEELLLVDLVEHPVLDALSLLQKSAILYVVEHCVAELEEGVPSALLLRDELDLSEYVFGFGDLAWDIVVHHVRSLLYIFYPHCFQLCIFIQTGYQVHQLLKSLHR